MRAILAFCFLALAPLANSEVIEEETWYDAEGKVIKTVKRTLTGKDAQPAADWEPAWVIRERTRGSTVGRSYYSPRSYRSGYSYGYGRGSYCGSYYPRYPYGYGSYGRRSYGGFRGYYSNGRLGVSVRTPGFTLSYRR